MTMFTVNEQCIKCGLCAKLCPAGIISFQSGAAPFVQSDDEKKCIGCGQCVAFCPKSCCFLDFQSDRVPVRSELMPAVESAETFLRSRRSIRSYKDNPLDEVLVRRILETARYAPSASNSQPVRWIVTSSKEKTVEIGRLVVDELRKWVASAQEIGRRYAPVVAAWDNGIDSIFRGAPQLAVAVVDKTHYFPEDAAFALTYFELAAHANGIGCCWAGFFTLTARKSPAIQKALGLSESELIAGGQMFGYPKNITLAHILPPRKNANITWL